VKAKDVLKYGNLHQLAGVLPLTLTDGPEKGVRGALIRAGSALNLLVLADRGMDIGLAEFEEKISIGTAILASSIPLTLSPKETGGCGVFMEVSSRRAALPTWVRRP